MKTEDSTNLPTEEPPEKDYVLKIELGLIFPMRSAPNDEAIQAQAQILADNLVEHIRAFVPAPHIVHILNGEAMSREAFDERKEQAKRQAAALSQLLQTISESGVEAFINGERVTPGPDASEGAQVDQQASGGDAVVDAVEPSPDSFRAPGSRSVN